MGFRGAALLGRACRQDRKADLSGKIPEKAFREDSGGVRAV
jgi:hypothetical protein